MNICKFILTYCLILKFKQLQAVKWSCEYNIGDGLKGTNKYYCELSSNSRYVTEVAEIKGRHKSGMFNEKVSLLDIESNLFTFKSIFCEKFTNLESILAINININSIDENSLQDCKNLSEIFLDINFLRNVPGKLLVGNTKLILFSIAENNLKSLPDNFFKNQLQLERLELQSNHIEFLPAGIFQPLINLQYLLLQNNKLKVLNPEWFLNMRNLIFLNLQSNRISGVPSGTFKSLESLQKLFLGQNQIKNLTTSYFEGLQKLTYLELQNNRITELSVGVFIPLENLKKLLLNSNKLTVVHADSFGIHNNLTIDFDDNKIRGIDKNIINQVSSITISMAKNVCYKNHSMINDEFEVKLQKCFKNYQPRISIICGTPVIAKGNIIGGTQIDRGLYPWNAALQRTNGKFFCGGTLISNSNVVTAAHCIHGKNKPFPILPRDFVVLLGVHDLNNQNEAGREIFAVDNIYKHDNWNSSAANYDADIAVLILKHQVTFGRFIQPICLIQPNAKIASITKGIVVGFGRSEDASKNHENIAKVLDMPIHSNNNCFLKNYILAMFSSNRTFCGGTGNGTGVCDGDSGSGLYIKYKNSYYLRGIVSASLYVRDYDSNCDVNNYSIFTDVQKFTDWIDEINLVEEFNDEIFGRSE